MYKPLEIEVMELGGLHSSLRAMRLPHWSKGDTPWGSLTIGPNDTRLAKRLVLHRDDYGKFTRGVQVWAQMKCQVGWLIQFVTYRIGVECLSSSSTMHSDDLKKLSGVELIEKKQGDLEELVYTRVEMFSYQTLRRIYGARRNHRHLDWKIFCRWVEELPHFDTLIMPEGYDLIKHNPLNL